MKYIFGIVLLIIGFCQMATGQQLEHKPRVSPTGLVTFKDSGQYIKITYGRPQLKNDREIPFWENTKIGLHAFGKLWRTGDDDATEITFTAPLKVGETELAPGTYSLFSIPDSLEWTIMLNREVGLWGHFKYDSTQDVVRQKVPVYKSPLVYEQFSIFLLKQDYGCDIVMIWGRTAIAIPLSYSRKKEE